MTNPTQASQQVPSGMIVLTDEQLFAIFEKARAGSDRPVGVLRGIRTVLAAAMPGQVEAESALDLFEVEQQRILALDPRERAMQHNYSRTMQVCYEFRQFIRVLKSASVSEQKGEV